MARVDVVPWSIASSSGPPSGATIAFIPSRGLHCGACAETAACVEIRAAIGALDDAGGNWQNRRPRCLARMTRLPADPPAAASPIRTLWLMVGIQFIMTMSFTVLSPVLPLFLQQIGVRGGQAIDLWTGVLNAATPLVAAFASPLWGRLSDRRGRKPMLLRSMIAISVFTGLMGFTTNVWQLFALRALMGAFSGFSAAAITLVASTIPAERLGFALGWLSTGQLVGGLFGPVVGGVVADLLGSARASFFMTSALATTATVIALVCVQDSFRPSKAGTQRGSVLDGFRMLASAPGLLSLFVVLLFAQFGVRIIQPVITLYVQTLVGNVPSLASLSGFAFSVTGLADVIASPFLGKRSDKLGYRRVLLISMCGAALFSIPQAFAHTYWEFVAERFGVGMFIGGILPTANALVGQLVPPDRRGAVYGLTASATFLGNSLGPLTGGAVAAAFGLRWVFLVTAGLLLGNMVWTWRAVPASVDAARAAEREATAADISATPGGRRPAA
jgi:DHA1 family multidrug resistance protein-like MFS transporter